MRRGFSLLELLIALAIGAVLIALALPAIRDLLLRYQLKAAVGDLVSAIDLTRSQAIARADRVLMVPLDAAGKNWGGGWVVFVDADGDRRPGPDEEVIAAHAPLADSLLFSTNFTSNKAPYYIAFNSAGRGCSATSSQAARWGTLSLYQGPHIRRIRINMLGRVRVCDPERDKEGCEGPDPN
ncbi:GspH/FimT family pseudopilin [Massilia sp. CF038]|uniref:GspH/FimT family pseudopilin n=1 Tax=Massilia sp. CF038 TaxID=1881045 RepID=UPI001E4A2CC1|nr:GspH/FimT family pseudopilin [Massilia sp. CF038]